MIPGFVVHLRCGMTCHVSNHAHVTVYPSGQPKMAIDYHWGIAHRAYKEHGRRWIEHLAMEAARELRCELSEEQDTAVEVFDRRAPEEGTG